MRTRCFLLLLVHSSRSDMYVFCCSYAHNVTAAGKWLAFVQTNVETANPGARW